MKKKTINIIAYLLLIGLGTLMARQDLGIQVFPVFGEAKRIGLGLILVPLMGILYGPILGAVGALAMAYFGQMLSPITAFAGPYTFVMAPLIALSCAWIKKRNWILSLLLALAVIGFWYYKVPADLNTGSLALIFTLSVLAYTIVAGVYGTGFTTSDNYFVQVMGFLIVVLAGMHVGVFIAATLSVGYYELPAFMWENMNTYTFLSIAYIFSFVALLPVLLFKILLPNFGFVLGKEYFWKDHGKLAKKRELHDR
ncbi:hypothetical protein JR334_08275 [Clostridia bacterium]|nr:hypothetical protein JR334_08275 [Clostridia bacterium]